MGGEATSQHLSRPAADLPARLGWVLERLRRWCRSLLLHQSDLSFQDHTIEPVKLAPDPVLKFAVSQG